MESPEKLIKQIADLSRNLESLVGEVKETNKQIKSSTQGIKDSVESSKKLAETTTKSTSQKTSQKEDSSSQKKENSKGNKDGDNYEGLKKLLEDSFSKIKPLKTEVDKDQRMKIPFLAEGGKIVKSGAAVVGEKGPEVVKLSKGDEVIPAEKTGDPVKSLATLMDAWEAKYKDKKGSIFGQPGDLIQGMISSVTGGKSGVGIIVPSKDQLDTKIKELLSGGPDKFINNMGDFDSEIYKFIKEKYGPYGLKLFLNPERLGDENYKGKFDLPATSEDLQNLYNKLNKKEETSAKQITETPKLEKTEKSTEEARKEGEENKSGGEKKSTKLEKIFGKSKEAGKKILGSKEAGTVANEIGGEKYGSLVGKGLSLLANKKSEDEFGTKEPGEKESKDSLGKKSEAAGKLISGTPSLSGEEKIKGGSEPEKSGEEGPKSREYYTSMSLINKMLSDQNENTDTSSASNLVSSSPEMIKTSSGTGKNSSGVASEDSSGTQSNSSSTQTSEPGGVSRSSSGGDSSNQSKSEGSSSKQNTLSQINSQDIQDIKNLLSAINTTLSSPLNISDSKPFRPKSNILEL